MPLVTPPFVQQGGSHPAATFRQALAGLLGAPFGSFAGGVAPTTGAGAHGVAGVGLAVTQNGTPNMSVNVAGGHAVVRGTEAAAQGCYAVYNDATTNLVIAAADPTNPRRDLIVVRVRDAFYSGAATDAALVVVTGTPAASPADPTPPANSLVLARVTVAAAATSIVNANITDLRTYAASAGAVVRCLSTGRPTGAALYPGLTIDELDTGNLLRWDGTRWALPANIAGGRVAFAQITANQTGITADVDITGLTATFTAVPTRRYRVTFEAFVSADAGSTVVAPFLSGGAGPTQLQSAQVICSTAGVLTKAVCSRILTGISGSYTVNARIVRVSGSGVVTVWAASVYPAFLLIEDIGT